jgi:glyoxylase-like metal-dependent hydrolase (beta-lactamase superfamily II)
VRRVTELPWTVAITHGHYDHRLGTPALLPCPVWAHPLMRNVGHLPRAHRPAHLVPASHHVDGSVELDLGERRVRLAHPGRGHTDHDVVAWLPDEQVLFAGDLVEQGAPPDYEDADPVAWPATLDALLALGPATVVPGHGEPVDAAFVAAQRAEIAEVTRLCRAVHDGELDEAAAWASSPYPADVSRAALLRYRFHT